MLKIFSFFLVIIVLYLSNSISNADSQNYGCIQSYSEFENLVNYECYLGDQDIVGIDLSLPSQDYGLGIDIFPKKGSVYYYDVSNEEYNLIPSNPFYNPSLLIYGTSEILILYYTPNLKFEGQDEFTYFMTNNIDASWSGTVTIYGEPYLSKEFNKVYDQFSDKLGNQESEIDPATSPTRLGDKNEHIQYYENGVIHFKNNKIHVIYGDIFNKWKSLDGLRGILGYPVSNQQEIVDTNNVVKFQQFKKDKQGGAIYLVNGTTKEIHGDIYAKWQELGAGNSCLGYPTSDVFSMNKDIQQSNFTNGILYWNSSTNEVLPKSCSKDN